MAIWARKYTGQIVFRQTILLLGIRKICPIVQVLYGYLCKWLDIAMSNSPVIGQCCVQLSNDWTVLYPTVQQLVS